MLLNTARSDSVKWLEQEKPSVYRYVPEKLSNCTKVKKRFIYRYLLNKSNNTIKISISMNYENKNILHG